MADEIKTIRTVETVRTDATPPLPVREHDDTVVESDDSPSLLSNILAIVGFVILIVIIIWGLIHLVELVVPWLSSSFRSSTQTEIQVQAPPAATSNEPMTVNWSYASSQTGTYDFLYQCNDRLSFDTTVNSKVEAIPCGAGFATAASSSMTVTPYLTGTSTLAEPITILFLPSATGGTQAQGHATISIGGGSAPASPAKNSVTSVIASGVPDLTVSVISSSVNSVGVATFVFDIQNIGTGPSGSYTFEAYLPTDQYGNTRSTYTYDSPLQASLSPGDHVTSTLTFTQAVPGVVSVLVDPNDRIRESNKTNNYASATLTLQGGAYYNNGSTNANTYYPSQYEYSY